MIDGISDLFSKFEYVRDYYQAKLGQNDAQVLQKYMESMYERAIKFIVSHGMQNMFEVRCRKIVEDTSGIGWGFHDGLSDMYYEYFEI